MYECMEGYYMNGSDWLVCHFDRTWHGVMPECLPVVCKEPFTPKNGGYLGSQFTYASVVEYFCGHGYTLLGDTLRLCQSNATWSGQQPECHPVDCGAPPPLQNAHPVGSYITTTLASTIEYQCHEGYISQMATSLYCTMDGVWMGEMHPCKPISCGVPSSLEHGEFPGNDHLFNSTVLYTCNNGYILSGSPNSMCQASGNWSSTTARCEPVTCPVLSIPDHGFVNSTEFYYPKSIKVSCSIGYILQGEEVVTCLENGVWSHSVPECVAVTCGRPDGIVNGSRTFSDVVFGADVLYDCHIGFRLQGATVRVCLANGSWSNDAPVCERISCGMPEMIRNGTVSQVEVFYGDLVLYVCDEGFKLVGRAESTCQADGSFSSVTQCQIVSCGAPLQIENGRAEFVESTFKSVGTYSCDTGYDLVGEPCVYCLSNGTWSLPTPRCERLSCGLPDGIENGWLELKNNNISYLANVTYYCDTGYDLIGAEIRTCLASGQWSLNVPICQPVSCGAPPELLNGDYTMSDITYGSTTTYMCRHGYYMTGNDSRTCLADQTWSFTSQSCSPVSCGEPSGIPHGSIQGFNWTYNASVTYVCDSGYEMLGLVSLICGADGVWLSDPPVCQPVQCRIPVAPLNGHVYTNSTSYQSVIEYSCDPGYELIGDALQMCVADGDWSGVLPQCLPVSCPEPPIVLNGSLLGNQTNVTFGSIARYTCDVGYELSDNGDDFTQCGEDGEWNMPSPRCEPVTCGYPQRPINGNVQFSDITYTSEAHYSCLKGFHLAGTEVQRCMADGAWSDKVPRCEPVVCGVPPSVTNAAWDKNGYDGEEDFKYDVVVHYTCLDGFELVTDGNALCKADGTWNITKESVCQIISCSEPTPIPNGQFHAVAYTYKSVITYQCEKGYELIGSGSARCNSDGNWSEAPPRCELITCPIVDAPEFGTVSGTNKYDDLLTFECSVTHELIGAKQIQCKETGDWNHPAPICKLRSCDQPPDLDNGVMFGQRFLKGDVVSYRCYSGYFLEGSRSQICQDSYTWSGDTPRCVGLDSFAAVNQHPVCILPCLHGGTCVGPYQCSCPYGYTGYRCEQVVCTNRCIGGSMCTGRYSQCPCQPDSTVSQCLRYRS
ncbi:sushi, von Willebrand factor type A, EGF and pentraxin domain-containing protein 1-like isoform X2 [Amphiura filiformis]|uniref:sushi, von Willebrand factor type A, EGF and pentraxin domain-containing protein 1-like isoform X2 n=1 Tax=Amphiura filiformis TaxID=82378 RepID=UPI003B217346